MKATTTDPARITETLRRSDGSSCASHLTSTEIETLKQQKSKHTRYLSNKYSNDRVKRDEPNKIIKKKTSDCKNRTIESRLKSYEDTQGIGCFEIPQRITYVLLNLFAGEGRKSNNMPDNEMFHKHYKSFLKQS